VAPEILRGSYGMPADMWTLGIVGFLMVYAAYPFDGESCQAVMQSILGSEPDWSDSCYALSQAARDFLRLLLVKDPGKRLTAMQARNHDWFSTACVTRANRTTTASRRSTMRLSRTMSSPANATVEKITPDSCRASFRASRTMTCRLEGAPMVNDAELPQIRGLPGQGRRASAYVTPELIRCYAN
jgi:serine/threonine protein kinase